MSQLRTELEEYLAVRRALGYKPLLPGRLLQRFVKFAERAGATYITTELALKWATQLSMTNFFDGQSALGDHVS